MQTGGLLHEMTVQDTVKMIAATFPRHLPLDDVVKQANLEPIYTRRVGKCSGGEQQRIRFALAILGNGHPHPGRAHHGNGRRRAQPVLAIDEAPV